MSTQHDEDSTQSYDYPLWVIVERKTIAIDVQRGTSELLPTSQVFLIGIDGNPAVAVFTDSDLAERAIKEFKVPSGWGFHKIVSEADLAVLLKNLLRMAIPGVAIDPSGKSAEYRKMADVLRQIERRK